LDPSSRNQSEWATLCDESSKGSGLLGEARIALSTRSMNGRMRSAFSGSTIERMSIDRDEAGDDATGDGVARGS
jgi:hypothetical protein